MRIKPLLLISFLLSGYINGNGQNADVESDRILAIQDSVWKSLMGKVFPIGGLKTIDGKRINADNLIGKPTLINFWFTTCKPCIDEMPVLNEIRKSYLNKANFIAITFEDGMKVNEFMKHHQYNFLQVTNAEKYIDNIGFVTFPVNVILDKNGIVVSIKAGIPYESNENNELKMGDGKELIDIIEKLL